MRSENRSYIPEVDHLRAFAALLILVYHGYQLIGSHLTYGRAFGSDLPWPQNASPVMAVVVEGHSAVSLFIVLSGFILSYGLFDKTVDFRGFLVARCARIYPMMILCLAMAVASASFDLSLIIGSVLPIDSRATVPSPFTSMFWAVKVELQCYLLFPAIVWILKSKGTKSLALIILIALIMRLICVYGAGGNPRDISYWTIAGRIDQFVIGILTAKLVRDFGLHRISKGWFLPAAAASVAMLTLLNRGGGWPSESVWKVFLPPIEGVVWAAFIVSYLSFGQAIPRMVSTVIAAVGAVSYSAYLLHPVVMEAVIQHQLWVRMAGRSDLDAIVTTLVVVFPLVTALATLTYHVVEKPFMQLRPRYTPEHRVDT
jgi:peptidoglycan/LPS O-acetylase OafA/YrhL